MSASLSVGKTEFAEAVRIRQQSDRIMSIGWIFLPFISILIGFGSIALLFVGHMAGAGISIALDFVELILFVVFWYLLISRRNNHFKRDKLERDSLVEYVRQLGVNTGKSNDISAELATMTTINGEATAEETEKSAVLWIILSIITFGIAGLYVLYFLTRDPYNHDRRQQSFIQQTQSAMSKLGKVVVNPSWKSLPSRSFILYFILSLVTLGLFEFYWYYVLIKDFNEHFRAQWQFEDSMASVM
jgi:hypothetical protein